MTVKPINFIYMAILIFTTASVASDSRLKEDIKQLRWIESADPIQDANRAIAQDDCRLKTMPGYTTVYPGVDINVSDKYSTLYGEYRIKGTRHSHSFGGIGNIHTKLQSKALGYAKKYNPIVVNAIEKGQCTKRDVEYIPPVYESDENIF